MPALVFVVALVAAAPQAAGQPRVNPDAKILQAFTDRVTRYAELHKKLEETLPALKDESDPHQIHAHRLALAKLIRDARRGAQPGQIFTRQTRRLFRRLIYNVVHSPDGPAVRAAIFDENTRAVPLEVNGPYPSSVPLSTVPPVLLLAMPRLPEEVEFRFVGRQLILFDLDAQIIVDFMADALR